jgi:gas vesicle protein
MSNEKDVSSIILSFFLGTLAGATLALLLAPEPGRKTRRRIKEFAEDVVEKAQDSLEEVKDKVDFAAEKGRRLFKA